MIGFDEAIARLGDVARPLMRERVSLRQAHQRVLADAVIAGLDAPRADTSAMDGYAVQAADVATLPVRLKVIGQAFAGTPFDGAVVPGECVRIFTGATVPAGADRVIIQEIVRRDGDIALFAHTVGGGRHIRPRGSDFRRGERVLEAGRRLDPRAMVVAAGADVSAVDVWTRPRVMVLGVGDELAEPGQAAATLTAIPESVSLGVRGMALCQGADVLDGQRLPDDPAVLEAAATRALDQADLVVVIGGASVGDKDYARAMFAPSGLDLVFSKVAIRPGKPVWLGRAAGKLVLGLPGNPTSAMVTARLFLAPLLAGLAGAAPAGALAWRPAPLDGDLPPCGERETFHRATAGEAGVRPVGNQDSSAQKALAAADVLIRRRAGERAARAGEIVQTLAF